MRWWPWAWRARGKLVTLETVARCMPAGILIGVAVTLFSLQHALLPAYGVLLLIGALGGFFVVPLNALLQAIGKASVGAGNAIAVQNLGENMAMLLMLGLYSLAVKSVRRWSAWALGLGRCLRWRLRRCGSGSAAGSRLRSGVGIHRVHRFDFSQHLFAENRCRLSTFVFSCSIVVAPQQGAGDEGLTAHESQRHLRRIEVMPFGNIHIGRNGFLRLPHCNA